jgi:ATP/maltotriose-dependent transcriptional regulator MalT
MGIGEVDFKSGDLDAAEKRFREALQSRQQMGEQSTSAESMLALADLLCEKGRLPEADQMARTAVAIFQKEQRPDVMAMARSTLCRIAIARRDLGAARQFLRDAQSAQGSDEYAISLTEAKLALASGKPTLAVKQLSDLVNETTRKGVVPMQMEARLALAEARIAAGQVEHARSELESLEWDATRKGFGLVARKAAQLRQKGTG